MAVPLTWIQVCHAVITQGSAFITGQRLPEGVSQAWWLAPVHLAFHPPLVQQAGRDIFHTSLLTVLVWDTSQLTLPSPSLVGTRLTHVCPAQAGAGVEQEWPKD